MKRVLLFCFLLTGLVSCGPSCPTEVSEDAQSFNAQLYQEIKERQIQGLIHPNQYMDAKIENAIGFEFWVAETKALLAYDQVGALASRFRYPFEVQLYDGSGNKTTSTPELVQQTIENEKDFCKYYRYFMTNELKDLVVGQNMDSLEVISQGERVIFDLGYFQVGKRQSAPREDYEVTFMFN